MDSSVIDILKRFTVNTSDWTAFCTLVANSPYRFLVFLVVTFVTLMLILSVFKIFTMILRIFLDWRMYR